MTAPDSPDRAHPSDEALNDFLGLLGYSSLGSFALLSEDAAHAPDMASRLMLSRMAAGELAGIDRVELLVAERGGDFDALMASYRDLFAGYLLRAVPRDWWERLVRSYVGYNMIQDMLRNLASCVPEGLRADTAASVGSSGHDDFVAAVLTPVIASEPQLAARLGLWGRRVVGEALTIVQRLFQEHPSLIELACGEQDPGMRIQRLVTDLQAEHSRRLGRLGLNA
jgi:hypothetical protein